MKGKGMGFWRVQKSARKCKRVRRQREIKEIDEVKGIKEGRTEDRAGDGVAISRQSIAWISCFVK
jgi:hypothetical protein